jgi:hypothetical protein
MRKPVATLAVAKMLDSCPAECRCRRLALPCRAGHSGEFHAAILLGSRARGAAKPTTVGVAFKPYLSARKVFDE